MADAETLETVTDDEDAEGEALSDARKIELHDQFMKAFDSAATPQAMIRAQAVQARRFGSIPGGQWEGSGWEEFGSNMVRVEVNRASRGLEKLTNDYRANRVTVDFRPIGDTDDDTADTLDGLFRADCYRCGAGEAFDNCFFEGASGGMGAVRLCNDDEDEYDPDNDHQVVNIEMIGDADQSVYFDPNSKRMDKRNADWGCVVTAVSKQAFVDEYGENRISDWPQGYLKPYFDWFTPDVVRVCEWYQVERNTEKLYVLTNALTDEEKRIWASEIDSDGLKTYTQGGWKLRTRNVKRKRVHKYILSGMEILKDCGLIAGGEIPIVPFYGKRWFIDNQEHFSGHIQTAMDSSRIVNTIVSSLVESVGSTPREVPVWYPQQIAGHGDDWARANKDRLPYLQINPMYDDTGALIPLQGPVYKTTPPELPAQMAALLQMATGFVDELTNADDGADEAKSNVSHEAMDLAATRTDEKSSGYMDNYRMFMQRVGEVWLSMNSETRVEEGRQVQTLDEDGAEQTATLAQPTVDKNGRYKVINDFAYGKFNVISDVTESSATKRDKTVRKALGLAQIAGPETPLGQAALVTAVSSMDGEGIDGLKKVARKQGLELGVFEPTDQEKQEAEQAQQQQAPDPASQALQAQAEKLLSEKGLNDAKTQTEGANAILKLADAHLKKSQADALGGPDAVPDTPTGLQHVAGAADVAAKVATANLNEAKAAHLRHDMEHKTIKRGHELALGAAGHELAVRQQDHAEQQPAANEAA